VEPDADTEFVQRKFEIHELGDPPKFEKFVCGKKLYKLRPTSSRPSASSFCSRRRTHGRRNAPSARKPARHSAIFTPEVIDDIHV